MSPTPAAHHACRVVDSVQSIDRIDYADVSSEPGIDGLGLQGEHCEHRLVHLPQRPVVDELRQRGQTEAVLHLGEPALLAGLSVTQDVQRIGVSGP